MKSGCAARASGGNGRRTHLRPLKSRAPVSASNRSGSAGSSAGEHRSLDPKARDQKSPTHHEGEVRIQVIKGQVPVEKIFLDPRVGKRSVKRPTIKVFSF